MDDIISREMRVRRDEYLARASEADKQAAQAKDTQVRESWQRIAESYRELAARVGRNIKSP